MLDQPQSKYGIELSRLAGGAPEGAATFAECIFETARESLLLLDGGLRIRAANRAFYASFRVMPIHTIGKVIFDLGNGQWNIPRLRELLEYVLPRNGLQYDFEVSHDFQHIGKRMMLINARRVFPGNGPGQGICLSIEDVTEKRQAQDMVWQINEELEERVKKRTQELEKTNREMEAFSYSVSHDLRSPLRAIEGYSRILVEDHSSSMPPEALEFSQDILRNALKMGQLIEVLLTFTGLSRHAFEKRTVSVDSIVAHVLRKFHAEQEARKVDVVIGDLPHCQADPALLKQVWMNLLSNAFKYTLKQPSPKIEIGSREENGEQIFFVRDNGAGFDMKYAEKLFGVFQRLHKPADFEGSGVGLAIVQNIIHRHGGRVWADAALNRGATFSFSLPAVENQS